MGQSETGHLLEGIRRIASGADPLDVIANATDIAARLAHEHPEGGLNAYEIATELVRLASDPDKPALSVLKGVAV